VGIILKTKNYSSQNQTGLLKPIIYCSKNNDLERTAVSVNKNISELLICFKPKQRTMHVGKCFEETLALLPDGVVIKEFDVLFNPNYQIDVIKILIKANKTKSFSAIWPGEIKGSTLVYSEEGYADYKKYEINDYDITCIV
jgi:hypothetical protein